MRRCDHTRRLSGLLLPMRELPMPRARPQSALGSKLSLRHWRALGMRTKGPVALPGWGATTWGTVRLPKAGTRQLRHSLDGVHRVRWRASRTLSIAPACRASVGKTVPALRRWPLAWCNLSSSGDLEKERALGKQARTRAPAAAHRSGDGGGAAPAAFPPCHWTRVHISRHSSFEGVQRLPDTAPIVGVAVPASGIRQAVDTAPRG
ncbi:hypothetical protein B0T24DRAFT_622762 [Lasiosphaeria ovina]|uniref:Uncharacterized protein n=1 Tax=Lasiosphaeria ovina TaxID=92902 RepID=A0AAE0KB00_9PEZI|nr:hypothetical protein B0T24DRAFT_622762 [Lasiosphaeria ovina]